MSDLVFAPKFLRLFGYCRNNIIAWVLRRYQMKYMINLKFSLLSSKITIASSCLEMKFVFYKNYENIFI